MVAEGRRSANSANITPFEWSQKGTGVQILQISRLLSWSQKDAGVQILHLSRLFSCSHFTCMFTIRNVKRTNYSTSSPLNFRYPLLHTPSSTIGQRCNVATLIVHPAFQQLSPRVYSRVHRKKRLSGPGISILGRTRNTTWVSGPGSFSPTSVKNSPTEIILATKFSPLCLFFWKSNNSKTGIFAFFLLHLWIFLCGCGICVRRSLRVVAYTTGGNIGMDLRSM